MEHPTKAVPEGTPDDELARLVRGETDLGLFRLMADRNKDEAWADAAWRELYDRHKNYMWTVCKNVAEDLHGEAWVDDIFQQTFARAYEKAATFKVPPGTSPESETRLVRGWLGTIAANILRGILLGHELEQTKDEEAWELIHESVEESKPSDERDTPEKAEQRRLITEALESLTEREQLVLRTTFQYYRIGKKHQRLPNAISQGLATQLATTPENLRKIRERALEKVTEYTTEQKRMTTYESSK